MVHTRFIALCYVTRRVVVCECEEAQDDLSGPSVALVKAILAFTWFYLLRQGWSVTRGPWAVASLGKHWIYYYRYI